MVIAIHLLSETYRTMCIAGEPPATGHHNASEAKAQGRRRSCGMPAHLRDLLGRELVSHVLPCEQREAADGLDAMLREAGSQICKARTRTGCGSRWCR